MPKKVHGQLEKKGTSCRPFIQTYTYDDLNRLESATETNDALQTWKQTFSYNRYGNRRFNTSGTNTTTLGGCSTEICNPEASTSRIHYATGDGYIQIERRQSKPNPSTGRKMRGNRR